MENKSRPHTHGREKFKQNEEVELSSRKPQTKYVLPSPNGISVTASGSEAKISPTKKISSTQPSTNADNTYKCHYLANLILKLLLNDNVEDFKLSSSTKQFDSFNDIVVKIKAKNRTETFVFLLKPVSEPTQIIEILKKTTKGDFDIGENCEVNQPRNLVVYYKDNTKTISQFKSDKLKTNQSSELIQSLHSGRCLTFKANEENFYLYTDQLGVQELRKCALKTFKKFFSSDESAFQEYVHFITRCTRNKGKIFELDQMWMRQVIALCVFSPIIKPLSFVDGGSVSKNRKIFREATSKFCFTVIKKTNFEKIESVWSDVVASLEDVEEVNRVNNKNQIIEEVIKTKKSLYTNEASKVTKLMWLLGKSPLVVEGSPQVYQTIKICQTKNLIVLDDQENCHLSTKSDQEFQKLSDLKSNEQLYEEIVNNFTYSLEGQKATTLKDLFKICNDVDNFITVDNIVEMLESPLLIGSQKEVLPSSYINRKLTKIAIDVKFLEEMDAKTVALVSRVEDINTFVQRGLPESEIRTIIDIDSAKQIEHHKIYVCRNDVSQERFTTLCGNNPEVRFHHFRYLDGNHLEWIRSDDFNELENFRVDPESSEYVQQASQVFNHSEQPINIICANPGMGKSTLMKSLKNNTCSSKWTILIYARNHALYFGKNEFKVDKFLKYFLEVVFQKYTNPLHQKVFKAMVEEKQIQLIWDGLDEISGGMLTSLLTLVEKISNQGIKQWLTCTNDLKTRVESRLKAFSRNLKQLEDEERKEYVESRLRVPEKELSRIFPKIKNNIESFPNSDILGIPMQMYMLTELLLNNKKKYLGLLDGIFTVLDLYEHFIEIVLYRNKKETALWNEQDAQNLKEVKIKLYKSIAATLFKFIKFPYNKDTKKFLKTIKSVGDDAGLISRVPNDNEAEFTHNSFGEYFAALYLFENEASKARHKKFVVGGRYNNIRFFLDLMLAKNSKCLVAVIYRNPTILEECTDEDLSQKDVIGRDVLKVASAWTKTFPIGVERTLLLNINTLENKGMHYREERKRFSKFDPSLASCFKKLMIFFPFLIPFFDESEFTEEYSPTVLYYAIRFDFLMIFECLEMSPSLKNAYNKLNPGNILALALYSRSRRILQKLFSEQRDFFEWDFLEQLPISNSEIDEIFVFVLQMPEFRVEVPNSRGQSLVHYGCEKNLPKTLRLLILKDAKLHVPDKRGRVPMCIAYDNGHWDVLKLLVANVTKIDFWDDNGRLPMHHACIRGDLDTMQLLVSNGIQVNVSDGDGLQPIHYACNVEKFPRTNGDKEVSNMVRFLIDHGTNVNVPGRNGQLPIHYTCQNGYLDTTKSLIVNGAKVNHPDGNGRLPIHHACENEHLDLVELLLRTGARLDVPDKDGRLPIHYACEKGHCDIVDLLITSGAKEDVPDGDGRLPIHYACAQEHLNLVELLIRNGVNVNVPDKSRRRPIHYACEKGHCPVVNLLIKSGAKENVPDGDGRLPIHYACEKELDLVELLIKNGAKMDVPDKDGRLPIHYACEKEHQGILKLLINNGAKIDVPDKYGRLPIHCVCATEHLDLVELLIKNGAKVDVPDKNGRLPIHYACEKGHSVVVDLLIKSDVKLDVSDGSGRRPIHYACENSHSNIVKILVENSAELNVPDQKGWLPIHYASGNNYLDPLRLLMTHSVKIDAPDEDGRRPIHYACEKGYLLTTSLLKTSGAKLDVVDKSHRLPIHYACQSGYLGVVKLLIASGVALDVPDDNGWLPIHYACEVGHLDTINLLITSGSEVNVPDGDGRLPIDHAREKGHLDCENLLEGNGAKTAYT